MTNGHRFSCQRLLAKAASDRYLRKKMFGGIQKRFTAAIEFDKENKVKELVEMQEILLGDADALLTNPNNECIVFQIYDMLSRVHQCAKNVHEFH